MTDNTEAEKPEEKGEIKVDGQVFDAAMKQLSATSEMLQRKLPMGLFGVQQCLVKITEAHMWLKETKGDLARYQEEKNGQ